MNHRDPNANEPSELTNHVVLKLFVTGQTPRSERAIANLRRICEDELAGQCEFAIVDVLERPDLAEQEKILATPTLVRQFPPPARRIIGDLSDPQRVFLGLSLNPKFMETDGRDEHP